MAASISDRTFTIEGYDFKPAELEKMITSLNPKDTGFFGFFTSQTKKQAINKIVAQFQKREGKEIGSGTLEIVQRFEVIRSLVPESQRKLFVLSTLDTDYDNIGAIRLDINYAPIRVSGSNKPDIGTLHKDNQYYKQIHRKQNLRDVLQPLCEIKLMEKVSAYEYTEDEFKLESESKNESTEEAEVNFKKLLQCSQRVSGLSVADSAGFDIKISDSGTAPKNYRVVCKLGFEGIYTVNITQEQCDKLKVAVAIINARNKTQEENIEDLFTCHKGVFGLDASASAGLTIEIEESKSDYKVVCKLGDAEVYTITENFDKEQRARLAVAAARINARNKTQKENIDDLFTCHNGVFGLSASASAGLTIEIEESKSDYKVVCKLGDAEVYTITENVNKEQRARLAVAAASVNIRRIAAATLAQGEEAHSKDAIEYMTAADSQSRRKLLDPDFKGFKGVKLAMCQPKDEEFYELTFKSQENDETVKLIIKHPFPSGFQRNTSSSPSHQTDAEQIVVPTWKKASEDKKILEAEVKDNGYNSIRALLAKHRGTFKDIVLFNAVKQELAELNQRTGGRGECFYDTDIMRVLRDVEVGSTNVGALAQVPSAIT